MDAVVRQRRQGICNEQATEGRGNGTVMEAFSKVKDADGKMVGPAFKTMKSEFVAWQEAISAKKYDLHDEPEGAFTQRNMNMMTLIAD